MSDLFGGTAEHYARHRTGLPGEVVALLRSSVGADARRLLDLGTGTGLVVEALLPYGFDDVVAVDPDAALLAQAEVRLADHLEGAGGRVRLLAGSAEQVRLPEGWRPDLVTACRSFHWMDQRAVAPRVRDLLPSGGTFAVLGNGSLWASSVPWKTAARETVQAFLGPERRAGAGAYRHSGIDWASLMREVGFAEVREETVTARRDLRVEHVVPYVHSHSFAAPGLFGDRLAAFDEALAQRVAAYAVDGVLEDANDWTVLLATRSA